MYLCTNTWAIISSKSLSPTEEQLFIVVNGYRDQNKYTLDTVMLLFVLLNRYRTVTQTRFHFERRRSQTTMFRSALNASRPYAVFTARKRSLGQGNVFTPVILFSRGGGLEVGLNRFPACITGHMTSIWGEGYASGGGRVCIKGVRLQRGNHPPRTRKVNGTHPTAMLSC